MRNDQCIMKEIVNDSFYACKTPFVEVGGPIGPRFGLVAVVSDVTTVPPTLVDTDDETLLIELIGDTALTVPLLFDGDVAVAIAFVVDFVIKNFSNLAIICLP